MDEPQDVPRKYTLTLDELVDAIVHKLVRRTPELGPEIAGRLCTWNIHCTIKNGAISETTAELVSIGEKGG